MENEDRARESGSAAVREFLRTEGFGLSNADRSILQRFLSDEYAPLIGTVWQMVGKYRKGADDDRLLIISILGAFHFALEAPAIRDAYGPAAEDFQRLRRCAEELQAFFAGKRFGGLDRRKVKQFLRMLASVIDLFDRGEREVNNLPASLGLTRELHAPAAVRVMFMTKMCEGMAALFGRPLFEAVKAITEVVFEITMKDVDQVRSAWRHHGRKLGQ
jgi:hypothetical protein